MDERNERFTDPLQGYMGEGPIRTNWTEVLGPIYSAQCQIGQAKPRCADFQLNAAECMEAYGTHRGRKLCLPFLQDFVECSRQMMEMQRVAEMSKQRMKQLMRGERTFATYHDKVKPPRDSILFGPFHP